ncbi:MAG: hypothetical protein R3293_06065 [Candidatus Promineifilaceae bacterium]|nr:hypothetical protein [Candidatus Promineifilaceae bacterium]
MFEKFAHQDFDSAYRRRFWRKIGAWLTGSDNELLPYDEVRKQLPFQGQRYAGLQTIPLDKIVGSVGRYRDFDRAFLPTQKATSNRWVNISVAHYEDIPLPAIDVYKIGDVYFVRDGNHRVSVARERKQDYIDAYVTEVDIPVSLTPDMGLGDVIKMKNYAEFLQLTNLTRNYPDANLETSYPEAYDRLVSHINTHAYYQNIERNAEVSFDEAVSSWYENVYLPLAQQIVDQGLDKALPNYTLTDLYIFISDYQWLLREFEADDDEEKGVALKLAEFHSDKDVRKILSYLQRKNWISQMIIERERNEFLDATKLNFIRPETEIELSLPGKYANLLQHIYAHHYYLGLERQTDVPYEEAVASFIDNVFNPLLALIDDQDTLDDFQQRRTKADLVLWVLDHRQDLVEAITSYSGDQEA